MQDGAYELFELLFVGSGARLRRIALQEMNRDEEELLGRSVGRVLLFCTDSRERDRWSGKRALSRSASE